MQMQGPNASMRKSLRSIIGMQNQKLSVWTTKGSRCLKSTTGTKNNSCQGLEAIFALFIKTHFKYKEIGKVKVNV